MKKKIISTLVFTLALVPAATSLAQPVVLDPVVVTSTRTARPISEAAASVSVIAADEITATGATRLDEVLRNTVGMDIVSNGPDGALSTASIRGSEAAQVLVLLDGVRLNSAQNGQFDLSNLPVSLGEIERIEVMRGPAGTLYGTNALAGTIQIITKSPESTPISSVSWTEGRFRTRNLSASTSLRLDRFRYRLGARKDRSDGHRDNSDLDQHGFNGMLGLDLGAGYDLELLGFYLDKETGVPGSTSFPSPQARQWDENTDASLTLTGPAGPLDFTLRGIYGRQENEYQDPGGWFPTHDTHIQKTFGSEFQAVTENGPHTFLAGGDFYRDKLESSANGTPDEERWSVFGHYEIEATSWASLLLGVRYDAHSDFDNETSPRAVASFTLSDATRLRVSAAKGFRAPTLNDRYWPDTGYAIGNPDLSPETAWEYELALDQQLSDKGILTLAVFRKDADDLIEWAQNDSFVWTPSNISEARIYGFEADVRVYPCERLALGANYSYLHPKDTDTDKFLTGKLRHQAHAFFDVGPFAKARLRVDGRYHYYYPEANRDDKDHFVMDAALSRPFELHDAFTIEASISMKNLLDEEYEENPGYPMPPRQLFVGLTGSF